jgi:hypothetical protein
MVLNLSDRERDYLLELLDAAQKEKLHELHHADSHDFKSVLRQRMGLIDSLRAKLEPEQARR